MEILEAISESVQEGDHVRARALTQQAAQKGIPADQVFHGGLIAGMNLVSDRFRRHEVFLPDLLLAAKAMNAGLDLLKPFLARQNVPRLGKIVLGTVQGDLHDIGKNLVAVMLRGAGLEVIDLGYDVPSVRFVDAALTENVPIIGMSALLTTTMPRMKEVIGILGHRGLRGRIKTIIGGAPLSGEYAQEIGADAYGYDAANAVMRVKALLGLG
ncbi:MAG: corrinoid protein [Terriglobia bacterium]